VSDHHRPPLVASLAVATLVTALVALGVWVTGGVLTDDATLAKLATGIWFGLAGMLALLAALRWRTFALPVLAAVILTTASLGGYLLWTSTVDRVVVEDVLTAGEPTTTVPAATPRPTTPATAAPARPTGPVIVGRGAFRSGEHQTTGTAALLRRPDRTAVVTLTDLDTSPGPDLRVYLVPGSGDNVRGALDLGALRGNRGTQQYEVPAGRDPARYGAVIIWCRAFSVAFGTAALST
jgi:hypothetical protein